MISGVQIWLEVRERLLHAGHALRSRTPVTWVLVRRAITGLPVLFLAPMITYLFLTVSYALPQSGPAAQQAIGQQPYGYTAWFFHALGGNLGTSLATGTPVAQTLAPRVPLTAGLVVGAMLLSTLAGGALGVLSAVRGGVTGRALDVLAVGGFALPVFWLGPVLVEVFAVNLRLFPAVFNSPTSAGGWIRAFVLPVVTLSFGGIATVAKQTREAMLDVLGSEYIRMARARGIPASSIIFRHALKAASHKVMATLGVLTISLLSGTIFVEEIFALPGLGSQLLNSVQNHDWPVIVSIVFLFTLIVIAINLAIDLASTWLDPRLSLT